MQEWEKVSMLGRGQRDWGVVSMCGPQEICRLFQESMRSLLFPGVFQTVRGSWQACSK